MKKPLVIFLSPLPILISLTIVLLNTSLPAQETGRKPNILIYSRSTSPDTGKSSLKIINTSTTTELSKEGLNAIQIDDDINITEVLDNAGWFGAYFIIETLLSETSETTALEINCYSAWDRQILISTYQDGPFKRSVVQSVEKAMEKIIPVIITNLEIIKAQPPPGWDFWGNDDKETLEVDELKEDQPPVAEEIAEAATSEREIYRLYFTIAGGPLMETGEATRYFTLGRHISLSGGYRFQSTPIYLAIGGRMGWDQFKAEGILTSSDNNMLYIGPEIRAGMDVLSRATIFTRISGGTNWFTVDSQESISSSSLISFLSFGLGGEFYFTPGLGLFLSVDYTLHNEPSTLFSGFYPVLGISLYL